MSGSSGGGNTLREFLVSIGYQVNQTQQQNFVHGLRSATIEARLLSQAIEETARHVVRGVEEMTHALEDLYYTSMRTNAVVDNIKAMQYAASQMGSTAAAALSAIENLGKFVATNPAGEHFLNNIGVATRNANGSLKDMTEIMSGLAGVLSKMDLPHANVIAGIFGIDYKTLLAMREGMDGYAQSYKNMLSIVGVDGDQAAKTSHGILVEVRALEAGLQALWMKLVQTYGPGVQQAIQNFNRFYLAHIKDVLLVFQYLKDGFDTFVTVIERMVHRMMQLGGDLADWFNSLDRFSRGAIEVIGLLLAAWRYLNLGFMTTPLGIILSLAAGILLLYDDYKTWKEGGQSLIDWGKWEPGIKSTLAALGSLYKGFEDLGKIVWDFLKPKLDYIFDLAGWHSLDDVFKTLTSSLHSMLDVLTNVITIMSMILHGTTKAAIAPLIEQMRQSMGFIGADDEQSENFGSRMAVLGRRMLNGGVDPEGSQHEGEGTAEPMPTDASRAAVEKESWDFWKSQGFTDAGAAAMVAQEQTETGFDSRKWGAGTGDNGDAGGAFQHHKDRRDAILAASGYDVYSKDHMQQLRGMLAEMALGTDPQTGAAYPKIKNAFSARLGAEIGVDEIERPKDKAGNRIQRGANAVQIERFYRGLGNNTSAGGTVQNSTQAPSATDNSTSNSPTLNQQTTINIHSDDGHEMGRQVAREQSRVNNDAVRNLTPGAM